MDTKKWKKDYKLIFYFSFCFLHPKWFDTEADLHRCSETQKKKCISFLWRFLEIGRFMKIKEPLEKWCKKVNVKPHQIQHGDMTRIKSWPVFIITLLDLANKMSKQQT